MTSGTDSALPDGGSSRTKRVRNVTDVTDVTTDRQTETETEKQQCMRIRTMAYRYDAVALVAIHRLNSDFSISKHQIAEFHSTAPTSLP